MKETESAHWKILRNGTWCGFPKSGHDRVVVMLRPSGHTISMDTETQYLEEDMALATKMVEESKKLGKRMKPVIIKTTEEVDGETLTVSVKYRFGSITLESRAITSPAGTLSDHEVYYDLETARFKARELREYAAELEAAADYWEGME